MGNQTPATQGIRHRYHPSMSRWWLSRLQMFGLGRGKYVLETEPPTEKELQHHIHPKRRLDNGDCGV